MDKEKLIKILDLHNRYVNGEEGGERADLLGADLDYSCWTFACKTLTTKIDKRIAVQLLYHTISAMKSVDDEECKAFCKNETVLKLANQFHRAEECRKL